MDHLTGRQICQMMRQNKKTIRGIATQWHLTQKRVREVRARGVRGEHYVTDWLEILTTPSPPPAATPSAE